jgi:hypothetical protein
VNGRVGVVALVCGALFACAKEKPAPTPASTPATPPAPKPDAGDNGPPPIRTGPDCDQVLAALCELGEDVCSMLAERTRTHPPTAEDQVACNTMVKDPKRLEDLKNTVRAALDRKRKAEGATP